MRAQGNDGFDPGMRRARDLIRDCCLEAVEQARPELERFCGGDPQKKWPAMGSAFWAAASMSLAMAHGDESMFVKMMRKRVGDEQKLRDIHRAWQKEAAAASASSVMAHHH